MFTQMSELQSIKVNAQITGHFSKHNQIYTFLFFLLDGFNKLAEILMAHADLIHHSKFVFVPGMNDPGPGNLLPRPRIPNFFTSRFSSCIKNVLFTSNPCRIRYCTQEITILREDILARMRRNTLVKPVSSDIDDDRLHVSFHWKIHYILP